MRVDRNVSGKPRRKGAHMARHTEDRNYAKFPVLLLGLYALLVLVVIVLAIMGGLDEGAAGEQYVPGQPLDMVSMAAPRWSDAERMYRIGDRTSGACWLRIHIDGKWETWLVCEGHSYVAQEGDAR